MQNRLKQRLVRVTATDGAQHWVYQYSPADWRFAVRQVLKDRRDRKIPTVAAAGLIQIIVEEAE